MIAKLIPLAIQASMFLIMFCIALQASPRDLTQLLHRPGLLVRSLVAMNVIMPLLAVTLVLALELNHAIAIAFIALAVAPVPPILPKKEAKAGGAQSYIIGLLAVTSVASIVLVPATVDLLARLFERAVHVSPRTVAGIVA